MAALNSTRHGPIKAALVLAGALGLTACNQTSGRAPVAEVYASILGPDHRSIQSPFSPVQEGPSAVVDVCRDTIAERAKAHGAIQVEVVSAGEPNHLPSGVTEAPLEARIVYRQEEQVQVRQAAVTCRLDHQGSVVGLLEPDPMGSEPRPRQQASVEEAKEPSLPASPKQSRGRR